MKFSFPAREFFELTKPKVVALMLITTLVGMFMSTPESIPFQTLWVSLLGIGLMAAAAAVLNHIADQQRDKLMRRTQNRPLPQGKISQAQAICFAVILMVLSFALLMRYVNTLTAILSFVGLIGYAGIYTLILKHLTPQNIVIGGLAGALPPLLGWTAVTNEVSPHALLLVLIIFVWTPPHFWSLALHRLKDYQKAQTPMLPVTHGVNFTKRCIFLYGFLLLGVSLLPFAVGMSGLLYLTGALILGLCFLGLCARLLWGQHPLAAIQLFHFSNLYLSLLFILLLCDHYYLI